MEHVTWRVWAGAEKCGRTGQNDCRTNFIPSPAPSCSRPARLKSLDSSRSTTTCSPPRRSLQHRQSQCPGALSLPPRGVATLSPGTHRGKRALQSGQRHWREWVRMPASSSDSCPSFSFPGRLFLSNCSVKCAFFLSRFWSAVLRLEDRGEHARRRREGHCGQRDCEPQAKHTPMCLPCDFGCQERCMGPALSLTGFEASRCGHQ